MDDPSLSDGSSSPSQYDAKLEAQSHQDPSTNLSLWKRLARHLTPWRSGHDLDQNVQFTTSLMLLCAFASAVSSGNLFYIYPVLNKAAADFGVSYERASLIPQLLGGGYGLGILFLCPIGDIARIRPTILTLATLATGAWLGLCLTSNFQVFTALCFLNGFFTVSPQLLIPLVGALAPPALQATAVSIVLAGLMMGLALPRVITGIAVQYTPWRNIYWAAFGLQCLLVLVMYLFFPDIALPEAPSKDGTLRYFERYSKILGSILKLFVTKPILAYGCIVTMLTNAVLASFWTTLTAHLAAGPFHFGPLQIGLFSLIAVGTTALIPVYSYFCIERYTTYVVSTLGLLYGLTSIALDIFIGSPLSIGGPILQALGVDFGLQVASVSYRAAIYRSLEAQDINKATVIFTCCAFLGQLMGSAVGNALYANGGWIKVGIFHAALTGATLVVVCLKGPKESGWFGWTGGAPLRLEDAPGKPTEIPTAEVRDING
ncbi:putative transporter [Rhypophila sp. PSN 637]